MSTLRITWRATALSLWTASLYLLLLAGTPGLAVWPGALRWWRTRMFRLWARGGATVLGMKVEVQGLPPVAPFFLVSNHLSYLDILVLASCLDAAFVAKSDVRGWPVVGLLCRAAGTLFVSRESRLDVARVNRSIEKALAIGYGLVLFPEGTSTEGSCVAPFRAPLLAHPARQGLSVHYASLTYCTPPGSPPAHLAVCWWGDMPFLSHLAALLRLPSLRANLRFGREPLRDDDRKRLAMRLHRAVSESFIPVVASPDLDDQRQQGVGES